MMKRKIHVTGRVQKRGGQYRKRWLIWMLSIMLPVVVLAPDEALATPSPVWHQASDLTLQPCVPARVATVTLSTAQGNVNGAKVVQLVMDAGAGTVNWAGAKINIIEKQNTLSCDDGAFVFEYTGLRSADRHALLYVKRAYAATSSVNFAPFAGKDDTAFFDGIAGVISTGKSVFGGQQATPATWGGASGPGPRPKSFTAAGYVQAPVGEETAGSEQPMTDIWIPVLYKAGLKTGAWDYGNVSPGIPWFMDAEIDIVWDGTPGTDPTRYDIPPDFFRACVGGSTSFSAGETCGGVNIARGMSTNKKVSILFDTKK
ncbi:hypothetical protein [Enterobacter ludwigii]|uniref:hypothetical protein n=1 Tax=Enterobacter ludwigii TaxID=299767 RepID=UPI0006431547|nr:hypothetical protein [Enterobacter ludwigii]KLP39094.1 hypothetical protein ABR36_11315 [Enterobacter ludwigii]